MYRDGLATFAWKSVRCQKVWEHGRALTLAEMRMLNEKVPEGIIIIAQHSGELIYVPPGRVHVVHAVIINMRHYIKFAIDIYVPTHTHMYAFGMALVGSPYTTWRMVTDYMYLCICHHTWIFVVQVYDLQSIAGTHTVKLYMSYY